VDGCKPLLAGSFNTWAEATTEAISLRNRLKRFSLKMANGQVAAAFERWVESTEETVEMKVKMKRALSKLMKWEMAGAFDRWAEMTQEAGAYTRPLLSST